MSTYANKLRRLAREAELVGEGLEQLVKLAFVIGFPDGISIELQQVEGVESLTVASLLKRTRVLTLNKVSGMAAEEKTFVKVLYSNTSI